MAGEIYRSLVQVGKQTSAQAAVAATRRVYVMQPSVTRERESRPKAFATGDRQPVRAHRSGPAVVAGSVQTGVVADELLEWLEATFGPAAISTPSGATLARRHVYTPGDPSYITVEHNDGATIWQGIGMRCNGMNVSLSVAGEVTVTFPLFGLERQPLSALTAALPERTPPTAEGWEARFFIDNLGATPGTTRVDDVLAAADISFTNNLGRKYLAANKREASLLPAGVIGLTGSLRMEAAQAQALTEYLNWEASTYRLFRLEIGNNDVIDAGTNEVQSITVNATGGTFTATSTASGTAETTAPIPWNATAAQLLAALLALPGYVYGDLATGGGPGGTAPLTVTHQGRYSGMDVPQLTTTVTGLTGGTSTAAVATTTPGVAGFKKLVWFDVPIAFTGVDTNQEGEGTREYSFPFTYVYDPTLAAAIKVTCQTSRTTAF
jgi:hypothetical protein